GMHNADALPQELQPQLGRRVDQDVTVGRINQDGAAIAVVARIGGSADAAVAADHWYADTGAGPQEGENPWSGHRTPYTDKPLPGAVSPFILASSFGMRLSGEVREAG